MGHFLAEWWRQIIERPGGPLGFRFYLQPMVAILLAIRDGIGDAHAGRPPYLWSLLTIKEGRRERIRSGWSSIVKVFILALVLDVIYQTSVLNEFRPVEGLVVAGALALVPYLLVRGPADRIARRVLDRAAHHAHHDRSARV